MFGIYKRDRKYGIRLERTWGTYATAEEAASKLRSIVRGPAIYLYFVDIVA